VFKAFNGVRGKAMH
jgi:hypothetical protein